MGGVAKFPGGFGGGLPFVDLGGGDFAHEVLTGHGGGGLDLAQEFFRVENLGGNGPIHRTARAETATRPASHLNDLRASPRKPRAQDFAMLPNRTPTPKHRIATPHHCSHSTCHLLVGVLQSSTGHARR